MSNTLTRYGKLPGFVILLTAATIAAGLLARAQQYHRYEPSAAAQGSGWNPYDKNAYVSLSNGNAMASRGAANGPHKVWAAVRGKAGKSAGKWYFRITMVSLNAAGGWIGGVADSAATLENYIGWDAHGAGFQTGGGFWRLMTQRPSSWDSAVQGSVIDIAVDVDAKKIWARLAGTASWNGSPGNSPAAGTGGLDISGIGPAVFPAWSGYGWAAPDQVTLDTFTVIDDPSLAGFKKWDD